MTGPPLGAIADAGGRRKPWILAFTAMCVVGSGLLWFVRPQGDAAAWAVLRFLLAHMLYADGLATLFTFGGIYAAGTFGMSLSQGIAFGVVLNITAGIGAFAFAWLDDWLGSRQTAALALAGLILASAAAVSVESRTWFWIAGAALGLFVSPVQAASRSFMARLSPEDRRAEFFGLFALSRKATAFVGSVMVAGATAVAASQRIGLAWAASILRRRWS